MVRLNNFIGLLESPKHPIGVGTFLSNGDLHRTRSIGESDLDFVIVDMEHDGFDLPRLADTLQWLISRRQITRTGSVAPSPTPIVRVPPDTAEHNRWIIKQVLDAGAFGVMSPRVQSAKDVEHLVRACRYARTGEDAGPQGERGVQPAIAMRYWGCRTFEEYFDAADLWPLNEKGEMLIIGIVEDIKGFQNIEEIVAVPGLGGILFGPGDGSVSLGDPTGNLENPELIIARERVVRACKMAGVPVGIPALSTKSEAVSATGFDPMIRAITLEDAIELGFDFVTGSFTQRPDLIIEMSPRSRSE